MGKKKKGKKKGKKRGKKNLAIVEELDEMHKDPKDRPWVSLSSVEQKDAKLLGWDATGWDGTAHTIFHHPVHYKVVVSCNLDNVANIVPYQHGVANSTDPVSCFGQRAIRHQ